MTVSVSMWGMSIFETRLLADATSLLDSSYHTQLPLDSSHDTHLILVTIPKTQTCTQGGAYKHSFATSTHSHAHITSTDSHAHIYATPTHPGAVEMMRALGLRYMLVTADGKLGTYLLTLLLQRRSLASSAPPLT